MQRKVFSSFIIAVLFSCSIILTSCSAITAQNITNNGSAQGMNGNQRMNGAQGTNGNFKNGVTNASLMGKIISVDGSSIKIEVVEQSINNQSSKSTTDNQNNNVQSNANFSDNTSEVKSTGIEKIIEIGDGVSISQGMMEMQRQNNNSNSSIKVSDLKKGEIIAIWYKENTEIIERISVIQS